MEINAGARPKPWSPTSKTRFSWSPVVKLLVRGIVCWRGRRPTRGKGQWPCEIQSQSVLFRYPGASGIPKCRSDDSSPTAEQRASCMVQPARVQEPSSPSEPGGEGGFHKPMRCQRTRKSNPYNRVARGRLLIDAGPGPPSPRKSDGSVPNAHTRASGPSNRDQHPYNPKEHTP